MTNPADPAWLWLVREPAWSQVWGPILVAPFVGSFLGVLIMRLPAGRPVVFARSACPRCNARLGGWDLFPLFSFLWLRGRCRYCGQPIGWLHPLVELAAVAVAVWTVLADQEPSRIWVDCALGWTLLTMSWIDSVSLLLPDILTLPLLLAGLAVTFLSRPEFLVDHCLAAVLAYLAFAALALGYRRVRGRDGLGGGDAKLIAAAGGWCGLEALPFVVLGSAIIGLVAALGLVLSGRPVTARMRIPFGPCIALAFWLAWLHGGLMVALDEMLWGQG